MWFLIPIGVNVPLELVARFFCITSWKLWGCRNDCVFNQKQPSSIEVASKIKFCVQHLCEMVSVNQSNSVILVAAMVKFYVLINLEILLMLTIFLMILQDEL